MACNKYKPEYNFLLSDMKVNGCNWTYNMVEVGSIGHVPSYSVEPISDILSSDQSNLTVHVCINCSWLTVRQPGLLQGLSCANTCHP